MNYDAVNILSANVLFHLDLENDIKAQQNGLFTFIIKIARGNVADYNIVTYVDVRKYFKLKLKRIVVQQFTIARTVNVGNRENSVGADNRERPIERRSGSNSDDQYSEEHPKKV